MASKSRFFRPGGREKDFRPGGREKRQLGLWCQQFSGAGAECWAVL